MFEILIRIITRVLIPQNTRRGRKFRNFIFKFRKIRSINYIKARYNNFRNSYYQHSTTIKLDDESKKVSIVVPCFNTPEKYFEPLISSVFSQGYNNWELVIVDASNKEDITKYLKEKSKSDTRIIYKKVKNEGIAANTNKGIDIASGDFIAFLDHDDTLDPNALAESINYIQLHPNTKVVYSDEDKISDDGEKYFEPHFKPDFSIDMLRNVNYITHFVLAEKSLIDIIGGIRSGFDGAQDYDFLLRAYDQGAKFGHVGKILYHWRQADGSTASNFSSKKNILSAGCRALDDHFRRNNIDYIKAIAIKDRPGFYSIEVTKQFKKLRIYINLNSHKLLNQEKEFILNQYKKNKDVKKYKIQIIEGIPDKQTKDTLVVNGPYIPSNFQTKLISLFAVAKEDRVNAVSPKIVRHGRVYDMGIVYFNNQEKELFKGVNPERSLCFGSLEWVRNVNKLTERVVIKSEKPKNGGNLIVWSHTEFIAFESQYDIESNETNFYNSNLTELSEIIENTPDYVADLVEVKK